MLGDKDDGLVVLGFPANNFGAQEPGTNEEIKAFCHSKYMVTFPMYGSDVVASPYNPAQLRWYAANGITFCTGSLGASTRTRSTTSAGIFVGK